MDGRFARMVRSRSDLKGNAMRTHKRARAHDDENLEDAVDTTLDEVVALVLPYFAIELVDAASAPRIVSAVASVPAEVVARFGIECRLRGGADDAGVLFSADSETGGMQMLAGRHPLVNLPESLASSDGWTPVVRFCGRREPGFLLHRATRDVWVDLAQPEAPCFSFGLRMSGLPEATRRPLEVLLRSLEIGLEALRGAPLDPVALASMRALLRRMPDTARVERAGLVAGLADDVRLWLSRMSAEQLVELVEATRDRSEARHLQGALEDLVQDAGMLQARVDVAEGVERGIGLVCSVDQDGLPPQVAARWESLLGRLVEAGLCSSNKRDGLMTCYGLLRETQSERWPAHLTRLSELFGDGAESILRWRLHNVTIECDRGQPVHATAHIVVEHGWSRR